MKASSTEVRVTVSRVAARNGVDSTAPRTSQPPETHAERAGLLRFLRPARGAAWVRPYPDPGLDGVLRTTEIDQDLPPAGKPRRDAA